MINIKAFLSKKNIKFYEVNVPETAITEGVRFDNLNDFMKFVKEKIILLNYTLIRIIWKFVI